MSYILIAYRGWLWWRERVYYASGIESMREIQDRIFHLTLEHLRIGEKIRFRIIKYRFLADERAAIWEETLR